MSRLNTASGAPGKVRIWPRPPALPHGSADLRPGPLRTAAPRPARVPPRGARSDPGTALSNAAGFIVHRILAESRVDAPVGPPRNSILAAYRARLQQRISYSGPFSPIDLRV